MSRKYKVKLVILKTYTYISNNLGFLELHRPPIEILNKAVLESMYSRVCPNKYKYMDDEQSYEIRSRLEFLTSNLRY